jgi:hypothetical protein
MITQSWPMEAPIAQNFVRDRVDANTTQSLLQQRGYS